MRKRRPADAEATHEIVQLAARLLARGEALGIGHAIEKALRLTGQRGPAAAPDALRVFFALLDYQRLFERDSIAARTAHLRETALQVMGVLEVFSPRLHGPVLYGTPLPDTAVGLHLHSDETEAVSRHLLERRVPFRLNASQNSQGRTTPARWPVFECERRGVALALTVLPRSALRQRPRSTLTGGPVPSIDAQTLQIRLQEDPDGPWLEEVPRQPLDFNRR
jgi:hypothetical protein